MSIAFFDLDRTLLAVNSGTLWVRAERRLGYLGRREALRASGWLLRYHLGFADIATAVRAAIASLEGTDEAAIRARTRAFYRREVRDRVRPGAHEALAEHRRVGEPCVLLTTSSNYLSSLVSDDLGLDDYLCNRFEVDAAGIFTGRPVEPLCFGAGKVEVAQRYADARGVTLADCAFYSDSHSDLPMLEAVGRPVAVNPDPRLRRVSMARGWSVVDWGQPTAQPASGAA